MPDTTPPSYIDGPSGRIAYRRVEGKGPTIVWFSGYRSDMLGSKAIAVDAWACDRGRSYVRFDYSGHGESDGVFEEGSISSWTDDARRAIDELTDGPLILLGSSMGAWIAALIALGAPDRVAACVFLAPAPDFASKLMLPSFSAEMREALKRDGRVGIPNQYGDEPTPVTATFLEDGAKNCVMDGAINITAPMRIIQGTEDPDVPYTHAIEFLKLLKSDDATLTLVKGGDHRLSTPPDIDRLLATIEALE
ncbi:MAG: alpha/beta hydrolase [Pseudomonadota bacterium]